MLLFLKTNRDSAHCARKARQFISVRTKTAWLIELTFEHRTTIGTNEIAKNSFSFDIAVATFRHRRLMISFELSMMTSITAIAGIAMLEGMIPMIHANMAAPNSPPIVIMMSSSAVSSDPISGAGFSCLVLMGLI